MTDAYPRILILSSSAFNQYTGGGVFLTNMFRGWPSDKLAIAHGDSFLPDTSVCKNVFKLGINELHPAMPFRLFYSPPARTADTASISASSSAPLPWKSWLQPLIKWAIGPERPWRIRLTPELNAWIDKFQPELIYTLVGGAFMRAAVQIGDERRIPIVAHMMDDWPAQLVHHTILFPFYRCQLLKDLQKLFDKAALKLSICDAMSEAYEKRYGGKFFAFQNSIDVASRLSQARTVWKRGDPFRVCYVGSILPNAQLESLVDVARAVSALAAQKIPIEFHIYSPWAAHFQDRLKTSAAVHLHAAMNESEIFTGLTSSDLLLVPVNFDEASLTYIRYSMPAKIPLYLASGTPILVYGPAEAASVQYATNEKWARVVSERSPAALEAALRELVKNELLRSELGRRAMEVARKNHDGEHVRYDFRQKLIGIMPSNL